MFLRKTRWKRWKLLKIKIKIGNSDLFPFIQELKTKKVERLKGWKSEIFSFIDAQRMKIRGCMESISKNFGVHYFLINYNNYKLFVFHLNAFNKFLKFFLGGLYFNPPPCVHLWICFFDWDRWWTSASGKTCNLNSMAMSNGPHLNGSFHAKKNFIFFALNKYGFSCAPFGYLFFQLSL